jgi:rod shape-determining protein MreB
MQILSSALRSICDDFAIDLGTCNTLLYRKGIGLVCDEPSVVAMRWSASGGPHVLAVGSQAKKMLGRTPSSVTVTRPLRDGVIVDVDAAEVLLRHFLNKALDSRVSRRLVICVSSGLTSLERRAIEETVQRVGIRELHLVAQLIASAIGAGLPINEPLGNMIMDIGGGTTELGVISLGQVVFSQRLRVGGDAIDEAICEQIKKNYDLEIGSGTAESIKLMIGSVKPDAERNVLLIGGRDVVTGRPKTVPISNKEICETLKNWAHPLIEAVRTVLQNTPPDLTSDIADRGITLTGGGALLRNLAALLREEVGLPFRLANDPLKCAVMGAGQLVEHSSVLRQMALS